MELTNAFKRTLIETGKTLKGADRRLFMARTVRSVGPGGQRLAERELGWNRVTIRKGVHELETGIRCQDACHLRGRRPAEQRLPRLLDDIRDLVDGQSQSDPRFRSKRLYVRLSAAKVRDLLISKKGYEDDDLPTARTIGKKLNDLGFHLRKVAKCKPKKKSGKLTPSSTASLRSTRKPTPRMRNSDSRSTQKRP